MTRDLKIKKLKLANTCMNIAKYMAELNSMLNDVETINELWYKCPMTDEVGLLHLVTTAHEFSMISQWLKKHEI